MKIEPRQKPVPDHRSDDADACVADNPEVIAAHNLAGPQPRQRAGSRSFVRWKNARDILASSSQTRLVTVGFIRGKRVTAGSRLDPWHRALLDAGGIEGEHLKCAKGRWTLDGDAVSVGDDGLNIVVVMDTACHGQVRWEDQAIVTDVSPDAVAHGLALGQDLMAKPD
jgi:hypothetical protein